MKVGTYWTGYRGLEYDKNYVFTQDNGRMMYIGTPYREMIKIINLYNTQYADPDKGLPKIRLHDLRHTNASTLLAAGTDVETVAKRLGHAKTSTTLDIYGHALRSRDQAATDTLSKLFHHKDKVDDDEDENEKNKKQA